MIARPDPTTAAQVGYLGPGSMARHVVLYTSAPGFTGEEAFRYELSYPCENVQGTVRVTVVDAVGNPDGDNDLNRTGDVNAQGTTMFRQLLGAPPGPSAREP